MFLLRIYFFKRQANIDVRNRDSTGTCSPIGKWWAMFSNLGRWLHFFQTNVRGFHFVVGFDIRGLHCVRDEVLHVLWLDCVCLFACRSYAAAVCHPYGQWCSCRCPYRGLFSFSSPIFVCIMYLVMSIVNEALICNTVLIVLCTVVVQ